MGRRPEHHHHRGRAQPAPALSVLLRAAALGIAAGCRASLGVAGPVLTSGAPRAGRVVAAVGVLGELTGDKLPGTPSRLLAPGPQGRATSAATGGALLAHRSGSTGWWVVAGGAAAAAASAVGTWGGAAWRAWAGDRGPDWPAALAEDAVALTLAALACRGSGTASTGPAGGPEGAPSTAPVPVVA